MSATLKKIGLGYDAKDLDANFLDAKKNPEFKKMIDNLGLPTALVKQHTSLLKQCVKEKENCANCRHLIDCTNEIQGYVYTPQVVDNQLQFRYQACPLLLKKMHSDEYLENIYLFDIPEEIKTASIKNIELDDEQRFETITWLKDFMKNYKRGKETKGLYLHGNFGVGKTYLIAATFNALAKRGEKSAIIYWPEFLRDLKASFSDDFDQKYNYIKNIPLLLIDDIGAENMTPWSRDEILSTLLQYRMQEHKTTFFTSNFNLEQLEQHLSTSSKGSENVKAQRIIERIKQLTVSEELLGKNRRK